MTEGAGTEKGTISTECRYFLPFLDRAEEGNTRRGKVNHARARVLDDGNEPHGDATEARHHRRGRRQVRALTHPFVEATKTYLEGVKPYYGDSTLERAKRDLHSIRLDPELLAAERR